MSSLNEFIKEEDLIESVKIQSHLDDEDKHAVNEILGDFLLSY
jgi:hypothetical protein